MTVDVLLVYPYFNEEIDTSVFRYPPLGLGYLASTLRRAGISVGLIDGTFSRREDVVKKIRDTQPSILGIYSMITINHHARMIAEAVHNDVGLLVAGGPLPTLTPNEFLDLFDVVVMHEGEDTFLEIVKRFLSDESWENVTGIAHSRNDNGFQMNKPREYEWNLDRISPPARDLFPNKAYMKYWERYHGHTATSLITTRGCPYLCDFCSNPVFGRSYRERSVENVLEEMKQIKETGYQRVFFTDDCFTMSSERVERICDLLIQEGIGLEWMCLSRADALEVRLAKKMARAGCTRIYFGIESGNDRMLQVMNKRIVLNDVRDAVRVASQAGIETGGFFILGYPGETNESLLDTLRFSSSLPLDYLSYSFPYPIFGTGLYTKVRNRINQPEWRKQRGKANRHQLLFAGDFSQTKLRFAKLKGSIQHSLRKRGMLGAAAAYIFEMLTDRIIPFLR